MIIGSIFMPVLTIFGYTVNFEFYKKKCKIDRSKMPLYELNKNK
jgi:hypothetical protein